MTRVAIMQPTWLPWIGWFDLMDQVDHFVLLDDVAFSRQSWQQRNRVKLPGGLHWLTVPVRTAGRLGAPIGDIEIADPRFFTRHVRTIEQGYAGAPGLGRVRPALRALTADWTLLVDANLALVDLLRGWLDVHTPMTRASRLGGAGDRVERLVALCRQLGADTYVTPPGALAYLATEAAPFAAAGIEVVVHAYAHPTYAQPHPPFAPYASAIDLVLSEDERAPAVMRSGRRAPVPLAEALAARQETAVA